MTADGQPVQLATSYGPAGLTEGTGVALPEQGSYAGRGVIERMGSIGIEIDQVVVDMAVRKCLLAEAAALAMPPGSAVIAIERTHLSGGEPVETADIVIPAERYRLGIASACPGRPHDPPGDARGRARHLPDDPRPRGLRAGTARGHRRGAGSASVAVRPGSGGLRACGRARGTGRRLALWFLNYSTWQSRPGIYLEDLYVRPEFRGGGYGRQLLTELAALCVERGYGRLDWAALDWNEPARGFYARLGATSQDDWTINRLTGAALRSLAAARPPGAR